MRMNFVEMRILECNVADNWRLFFFLTRRRELLLEHALAEIVGDASRCLVPVVLQLQAVAHD